MAEIKVEGLAEYNERENNMNELNRRICILYEDKYAIEKECRRLSDEATKMSEERFLWGDKAVKAHSFWTNEGNTEVAKIIRLPDAHFSLAYIVSSASEEEHEYHTTSVGFLMRYPVPITEEEYNKKRNNQLKIKELWQK